MGCTEYSVGTIRDGDAENCASDDLAVLTLQR
jgi:hypothetical protein